MLQRKVSFLLKLVLLLNLVLAPTVLLAQPIAAAPVESAVFSLPIANDKTLRIDGSDEMFAINQMLKQRYEKQFPDAEVDLRTNGTDTALKKLLNDEIDLAAIGRPLTQAEKARGLIEIPISREKIAIIVGQENPFQGNLTVDQLSKIFRGEITNWSEVGGPAGRVRVIDRPENSDTRLALQQYQLFRGAEVPTGENVVRLTQDDTTSLIQALGSDGISYAIASQLIDQNEARIVKLVITLNVLPEDVLYPYVQPRSYVYKQAPGNAAQAFLGFATTRSGQAAVAAAKLAEAQAVAAGERIAPTPIAKVLPPIAASDDSIAEDQGNQLRFLWVVLPLMGVGLLLWWLRQRQSKPVSLSVPSVKPSAPPTSVSEPLPSEPVEELSVVTPVPEQQNEWDEADEAIPETTKQPTAEESPESITPEWVEVPEDAEAEQSVLEAVVLESVEVEQPVAETPTIPEPVVEEQPEATEELIVAEIVATEVVATETDTAELNTPEIVTAEIVVTEPDTAGIVTAEIIAPESVSTPETPIAEPPAEDERAEDEMVEWVEIETIQEAEPPAPDEAEPIVAEIVLHEPVPAEPASTELISSEQSDTATEFPLPTVESALTGVPAQFVSAMSQPEVIPPIPSFDADSDIVTFGQTFLNALRQQGHTLETATPLDCYSALASTLCSRLLSLNTPETYLAQPDVRVVGEIAAEYMPGPHLENSLINLGLLNEAQQAMQELGLNLTQLIEQEEEPGLGRGGLGRLMVCYLDSLSTANVPAIGYGIRYEYGIFDQKIEDGWQVEVTDTWLRNGNPWEVERLDQTVEVNFEGATEAYIDDQGGYRVRWLPAETIRGIPYDTPIPGYHTKTVNLLRLWRAETAENLCKVLYPVDIELQGKALRLKQQFFLVSCALQDAMRLHLQSGGQPQTLHQRFTLQLNDTDPTLAVAELMRLLVDEHGITWEQAWEVTQYTFAYTNHSLMPETLDDQWSVGVFGHFLPRHLEIIYEINYRFLESVKAKYADDGGRLNRMSLIDERGERYIRLNYLACVGSHAVNGVSALHTDLLKHTILRDFYQMYPEKFYSKTNGITPRRFLLQGNPELSALISSKIGDGWVTQLDALQGLEPFATDPEFCDQWRRIKQRAKQHLTAQIRQQTGVEVDPTSLFDVQAMGVHEYKRQHLNVLHILTLYNRIKANPDSHITPRTFIFAGKAAPDYFAAKLMIKLINAVAAVVNSDVDVRGRLKVVFLPDFNVKSAEPIYPAADLAEHISLAGTEAADTTNMIFALNGARLIGTPDGTNIEICEAIGADQFFLFGHTVQQVSERRARGYHPLELYNANPELKAAIDRLTSGALASGSSELFRPLVNLLLYYDQYMLLADYQSYIEAQAQVDQAYQDADDWTQRSILTTARMGKFSSDRAVQEYCQDIWQIAVPMPSESAQVKEYTPAKKWMG